MKSDFAIVRMEPTNRSAPFFYAAFSIALYQLDIIVDKGGVYDACAGSYHRYGPLQRGVMGGYKLSGIRSFVQVCVFFQQSSFCEGASTDF